MSVTFELLEEFTGTRTTDTPDPENDGQTVSIENPCRDINVKFTCENTGLVYQRQVNVCFTDGKYNHEETLVCIEQVGNGVAYKMECGVIS